VFGNFLFSKFFGNSIDEIADGRGFEPLFFHIQAEFQWQRPFSEGCRGEISEKSKKNLSQSYGRWIVGFHEPMTSALFCAQKGRYRLEVRNERRKCTAERKISARGRTEAPAQGAGRKAAGRGSGPRQMARKTALLG